MPQMTLSTLVDAGEIRRRDVEVIAEHLFGHAASASQEIADSILDGVTSKRMKLPAFQDLPENVRKGVIEALLKAEVMEAEE